MLRMIDVHMLEFALDSETTECVKLLCLDLEKLAERDLGTISFLGHHSHHHSQKVNHNGYLAGR